MTDIYEKIAAGEYEPKGEYPERPRKPEVLSKRAGDLTPEEFASLATVKTDYENALRECEESRHRYTLSRAEGADQFRIDLLEHFGIPDDDLAGELYDLAYDRGHANGFSEIASCFSDYARIYESARKFFGGAGA